MWTGKPARVLGYDIPFLSQKRADLIKKIPQIQ